MIVVCGEALIDLVATDTDTYRALPGGSPANVAVGLARLGVPVALLARVSHDAFGRMLARHLHDNGVDDRHIVQDVDAATTLAVASLDEQARADYAFYATGTADWQWSAEELPDPFDAAVRILHTGSLALALPPGAAVLEDLMRRERDRARLLISYDPNIRRALDPDPQGLRLRVERQVALATLVKVSADDLAEIYPGRSVDDVGPEWLTLGPSLVVVTHGPDGAVAVTKSQEVRRPAPAVVTVDTVGAGDAFTAALLAGLAALPASSASPGDDVAALSAGQLAALVDDAVAAASFTCTRPGADPPTREDLVAWRAGHGVGAGR